ncbi:hypothetical protein AJ80_08498 [Polytolypa hystricis UAMH7299]|uniref:FCP1 homology domain-containing protein n=1 Tax=Polytolypa hystricis (strain UAMH7299) TaxID=1447883 RepID=A0A2B7WYY7_POLH7|nr:hypothetical protein AJ80_08498 [Polytolypa hystricis UAMH7299]
MGRRSRRVDRDRPDEQEHDSGAGRRPDNWRPLRDRWGPDEGQRSKREFEHQPESRRQKQYTPRNGSPPRGPPRCPPEQRVLPSRSLMGRKLDPEATTFEPSPRHVEEEGGVSLDANSRSITRRRSKRIAMLDTKTASPQPEAPPPQPSAPIPSRNISLPSMMGQTSLFPNSPLPPMMGQTSLFTDSPLTPINALSSQPTAQSIQQTPYIPRDARPSNGGVISPPTPVPTASYLAQAALEPTIAKIPRPLLVVLDLNGTLVYRTHRGLPPKFKTRPGLQDFMDDLFAKYKVMVWTSSQPLTADLVLKRLFRGEVRNQLVATWARDTLSLTKTQYKEKVQVYKRLEKIWKDPSIQDEYPPNERKPEEYAGVWDQTNTILIDDSRLKAAGQPYNIIEIPEFTNDPCADEEKNLETVLRQLRILSAHEDVSQKLKQWDEAKKTKIPSHFLAGQHPNSKLEIDLFWEGQLRADELAISTKYQGTAATSGSQSLQETNFSELSRLFSQDGIPNEEKPKVRKKKKRANIDRLPHTKRHAARKLAEQQFELDQKKVWWPKEITKVPAAAEAELVEQNAGLQDSKLDIQVISKNARKRAGRRTRELQPEFASNPLGRGGTTREAESAQA